MYGDFRVHCFIDPCSTEEDQGQYIYIYKKRNLKTLTSFFLEFIRIFSGLNPLLYCSNSNSSAVLSTGLIFNLTDFNLIYLLQCIYRSHNVNLRFYTTKLTLICSCLSASFSTETVCFSDVRMEEAFLHSRLHCA